MSHGRDDWGMAYRDACWEQAKKAQIGLPEDAQSTSEKARRQDFWRSVRAAAERDHLMASETPKQVPVSDPWRHRSEGMRCKTCMWFAAKDPMPTENDPLGQRGVDVGRCRRHAPTMNGYPVVFVNDWCGDHKLNENAL